VPGSLVDTKIDKSETLLPSYQSDVVTVIMTAGNGMAPEGMRDAAVPRVWGATGAGAGAGGPRYFLGVLLAIGRIHFLISSSMSRRRGAWVRGVFGGTPSLSYTSFSISPSFSNFQW
jgi:hypothetical protein